MHPFDVCPPFCQQSRPCTPSKESILLLGKPSRGVNAFTAIVHSVMIDDSRAREGMFDGRDVNSSRADFVRYEAYEGVPEDFTFSLKGWRHIFEVLMNE